MSDTTGDDLTLHEAADVLGVHYMTAYRYVRLGLLPAAKAGGTCDPTGIVDLRATGCRVAVGCQNASARPAIGGETVQLCRVAVMAFNARSRTPGEGQPDKQEHGCGNGKSGHRHSPIEVVDEG